MLPARLVNADKVNDVAILKADGRFPAVPVVPSRATKVGEMVFVVGFPNGGAPGPGPKATWAEISSLTGAQNDPREFQITAAVQPRNSGGPLVNRFGNVVGVVGARPTESAAAKGPGGGRTDVNYAVKSALLSVLLDSLPDTSAKLKEPYPAKERRREEVVRESESATGLVLTY
jgi:S1-C subfamily serine protease